MVEVKIFEDGKEIVQQNGKAVMAFVKVHEDDKRSTVRTSLIGDSNIISMAEDVVLGLAFCMADKCKEDGAVLVADGVICQEEPDDDAVENCKALGKALA